MPEARARAIRARCVLALAAIVAIAATAPGARAAARAGPAPAPIVTPDPLGAPWTAARIGKLRDDLDGAFAERRGPGANAHVGFVALDTATGNVLYARDADDELQTASSLKLLVGSVALERLGPAFRFHTSVAYDPARAAVVLRGGGDPLLAHADLRAAAAAIRGTDVSVASVLVDDRRYEARPYPDGWNWDDFPFYYAPRLSGLQFEEGIDAYAVVPGDAVGAPASLALEGVPLVAPPTGCDRSVATIVPRVATGAAGSASTVDVDVDADGCTEIVGAVPLRATGATVDVTSRDPALAAGNALRVALALPPATTVARDAAPVDPHERVLWAHDSDPLSALLGPHFWLPSDNLVAETLLREVGIAATPGRGSTANGIAEEKRWLQTIGVDVATVSLSDGSGLSQYDRMTPRDLALVLQHDWNGRYRDLVLASLPVGGGGRGRIDGIAGTVAAGRVFAKTGSFSHVRGLAGFLAPLRHGAVTFAFLVDDWNGDESDLAAFRASVLARIVND